jgi:hypothetical protein
LQPNSQYLLQGASIFVIIICYNITESIKKGGTVLYKVKFSLCLIKHHAIKMYGENGGIAPHILNRSISSHLHALGNLPPGKEPQYPLDMRLGGR